MPNYLEFFPKPLLVDLCEGQVLPFIGSGFSLNAITPLGRHVALIGEIADCLNELMPDFVANSPQDVLSEFEARFGRTQFIEELYKVFLIGEAQPGAAHLAFAQLPFDIVATTNFDHLLEDAYIAVGRYPQVVQFESQLPVHDTADNPVQFLKVHGDIDYPDRLIFTEKDYDTFLERYPLYATYLACLLITRTALFVGYSVGDYDLRQIWELIGDRLGRLRRVAYAIEVGASQSTISRFQRRGVEVINLPGTGNPADIGGILAETFRQLREFLATGCPPRGVPPCSALGVPLMIPETTDPPAVDFAVPGEEIFPELPGADGDDAEGIGDDGSESPGARRDSSGSGDIARRIAMHLPRHHRHHRKRS